MTIPELIDDNESLILEIIDMLQDSSWWEYTYERDIIYNKLKDKYRFYRDGKIYDFYNREIWEVQVR